MQGGVGLLDFLGWPKAEEPPSLRQTQKARQQALPVTSAYPRQGKLHATTEMPVLGLLRGFWGA